MSMGVSDVSCVVARAESADMVAVGLPGWMRS
jgi:hypothetical protein